MLLDASSRPDNLREIGLRWWANERFAIGWKGHLYLPGYKAGEDSVAALAAMLETSALAQLAGQLRGVFGLFVQDCIRGGWQITVDNSGLYKVFYDARGVSTRFLELVRARRVGRDGLANDALLEFLAYGAVFCGRTFVKAIAELSGREVLDVPP